MMEISVSHIIKIIERIEIRSNTLGVRIAPNHNPDKPFIITKHLAGYVKLKE